MLALVLLALALALVTLVQVMRARRKRRPGEPPLVQGWIPYLGKALDFRNDSFGFLEDLRRKHGDVFTVLIAGKYMTFILNPLHFPNIIKLGRQLDFHEFSDKVASYAFGYTPLISGHFPGLMERLNCIFKLLQGPHLPALSESMMKNLLLVFREDHVESGAQSPEWRSARLYDFCLSVTLEATFMTIYGRSPSKHRHRRMEQIRQDFICFDKMFPLLVAQVPLWLLGRTESVRQKLIDGFCPSDISEWSEASLFIQRRRDLFDEYENMSSNEKAAQHFAVFWASIGNTSPAIFWCVYYLLRQQEALQAVRAELQEVMSQEGLEPDSDLVLSRDQLNRLVVLESAVRESLRLSTMSMNVRVAQDDFTFRLDSPWSIRKGDLISIYPQNTHMDPEIYPEPTSFQFDRYLDNGKEKTDFYKSGQRVKHYLMPFGSGASKCPGRYIALQEIKQFVSLLLLFFDLELTDTNAHVQPDLARAGLGIMQPASDVAFRYRLRWPLDPEM